MVYGLGKPRDCASGQTCSTTGEARLGIVVRASLPNPQPRGPYMTTPTQVARTLAEIIVGDQNPERRAKARALHSASTPLQSPISQRRNSMKPWSRAPLAP